MRGWIKLHRKLRGNPVFNNPNLLRLWLICLTEASHKSRQQMIGNQVVELEPGQFVTGRFDLFDMFNDGLTKSDKAKSERTVYRWLEKLEEMNFLSIKKTTKYSLVTINKWALYQQDDKLIDHSSDHQMSNECPSNDHQMSTNKNVKNLRIKEFKEEEEERSPIGNDSPFQQIEDKYLSRKGGLMLTPADAQAIERVIHEKIPLEDILVWIDEIFDQYRPRHRADGIKSFSYLEKGILDRWHAKNNQPSNISEFKPKKQQDNLSALEAYAKEKGIKFGGGLA
ncbi:hypothetical protein [Bacillus pumilus]|uniref:hypothetical protein n=1 Tax=Bacillus pumilus TaxID=1408 RepID=UPI00137485EB|nr:hypothetical protein [Bacillus pumilus]MBU8728341.1 hypothetical protein [Bacillus pumilus]QHQ75085.1 hypothetical protein GPS65_02765 [Bacillus pumilus]